jgi:RNA polymerase sigma factor (sigma-70 family)
MQLQSSSAVTEPASDGRLLAEFVDSRSETAFRALVDRHSPMVLGVCRRMLRNADAEDAAQAVFVLFWQKAKQLKGDSVIAGWLHRTAHLVCRNAIRSLISRIKYEQNAAAELKTMGVQSPDTEQWREIREILDAEVNRLPDKLRLPFVLFHFENRSLAEVAEIIGSSVATVGTWLQRSRERLSDRLRKRGVTIGATAIAAILSQHATAEAVPAAFAAGTIQAVSGFTAGGIAAGAGSSPAIAAFVKASSAAASVKKAWIVATFMTAAVIGLPVTVFWILPTIQTRQSADFPLMQGTWREIDTEQNGSSMDVLPKVEYVGSLVISGRKFHRFQTLASGQVLKGEQGSIVLNDTDDPKSIDFHTWAGSIYGIYQIDGDTLSLCATKDSGRRPGEFSTTMSDGRILTKYQRVK